MATEAFHSPFINMPKTECLFLFKQDAGLQIALFYHFYDVESHELLSVTLLDSE